MKHSNASTFLHGAPSPLIISRPAPPWSAGHLYARIASQKGVSFLFESGKGPLDTARYSFFGTDPYETFCASDGAWTLRHSHGHEESGRAPFQHLTARLDQSRIERPAGAPPFFGGAVGCLSYDFVRSYEALPVLAQDDLPVPEMAFGFFDVVAALDHLERRLILMYCPPLERFLGEPREKLHREGMDRLSALDARLADARQNSDVTKTPAPLTFTPGQNPAGYVERVLRCQEYIRAGDIYQANLSHRFTVQGPARCGLGSLDMQLALYDRLRAVNPSPFSGMLRSPEMQLISCSPERLVRLSGRRADTRPIAGTRPRGLAEADDRRLAEELQANEKERAEHLMLVDLERNDLGRVCEVGSVRVDDFMALEYYSHVIHLVSNVTGTLAPHATRSELLKAVFPGGTITGVPKIRCMQIIEELEPVRRGPYTGSMGYFSWSGDLDFNILIRTLVLHEGVGYLQVGAGIVADSDPAREYQETLYKAGAFFKALS
jgi:aminodeoxychorismate synthase component I